MLLKTRLAASMAVIRNSFAGCHAQDPSPMVRQLSTCLANGLMPRDCKLLGSPVEEYGKSALAGLDGEVEHGSAIVHFLSPPPMSAPPGRRQSFWTQTSQEFYSYPVK